MQVSNCGSCAVQAGYVENIISFIIASFSSASPKDVGCVREGEEHTHTEREREKGEYINFSCYGSRKKKEEKIVPPRHQL